MESLKEKPTMSIIEELRAKASRDNRDLLDRAADRIEELEGNYHKQEWISVEEVLPDCCGMSVLMVAVNQYSQTRVVKGFTDYQCPITFHTNEREFDGIWHAWEVTHWMPIPEPPKMKGD